MRIYAELPRRRNLQILADVLAMAWLVLGVRAADWLRDQVARAGGVGRRIEGTGVDVQEKLERASDQAHRVPGVGGSLASPFDTVAGAAQSVIDSGRDLQHTVHQIATVVFVIGVLITIAVLAGLWLPRRVRWIRSAAVHAALRDADSGRDLLALRALVTRPLAELAQGDDLAAGWRRADAAAIDRLAGLELTALGLRGT